MGERTVELGGESISIDFEGSITSGAESLRFASSIRTSDRYSDRLLLLRLGRSGNDLDSDLTVPTDRNIVAVGPGPTHEWTIGPPADPNAARYDQWYMLGDRIIARSDSNHFHEVDPETGEILDDWSNGKFVFESETVTFRGERVGSIQWFDGKVLISTTGKRLYGFDPDGTQLWKRPQEEKWGFVPEDGELLLWNGSNRANEIVVRLDTDTGRIVEQVSGAGDGEQYVDE